MSSPVPWQLEGRPEVQSWDASEGRRSLTAFVVSGMLMSFLGAILPAWRYHLRPDFREVGYYFLSLDIGFLLSVTASHYLMPRKGVKFILVAANLIACASFLGLAWATPPAPAAWRLLGVLGIGAGIGLLNSGIFQAIAPLYQQDRGATVNLAGVLFSLGCLLTALLVAGTYYVYTVPVIFAMFAVVPAFFAANFARAKLKGIAAPPPVPLGQVLRDFQNPGAILFSLLLFFQFGNEWSVAGWLPLFVIRQLGISPAVSLLMLALYWGALLVGRIVAQVALQRIGHGLILMGSITSAIFGIIVLSTTNNQFGAVMGILFLGSGFAPIYPLAVEKISHRFPYYHPGFYNAIFSFAITGGFLAPWILGYWTDAWGIQAVMILPLFGVLTVLMLVLLILLELKLSGLGKITKA